MAEPIPFFGWISDYEETEQMLRDQIHAQQTKIKELEKVIADLIKEKNNQ